MSSTTAHGDTKVYWLDNMLIVEPNATFNIEGVITSIKETEKLIDTRTVEKWARVVYFKNAGTLGPIDTVEHVIKTFEYGALNGCQLISVVAGNVLNKDGYAKVSKHVNLPIYFFDSLDEAKVFIKQSI